MKDSPEAEDDWKKVIVPFFESPKDNAPDTKALAELLRREDLPLPPGFRAALAEILDSLLPEQIACNWQLIPSYCGFHNKELKGKKDERSVDQGAADARKNGLSITSVMPDIAEKTCVSERKAWTIWGRISARRKFLEKTRNYWESLHR